MNLIDRYKKLDKIGLGIIYIGIILMMIGSGLFSSGAWILVFSIVFILIRMAQILYQKRAKDKGDYFGS